MYRAEVTPPDTRSIPTPLYPIRPGLTPGPFSCTLHKKEGHESTRIENPPAPATPARSSRRHKHANRPVRRTEPPTADLNSYSHCSENTPRFAAHTWKAVQAKRGRQRVLFMPQGGLADRVHPWPRSSVPHVRNPSRRLPRTAADTNTRTGQSSDGAHDSRSLIPIRVHSRSFVAQSLC